MDNASGAVQAVISTEPGKEVGIDRGNAKAVIWDKEKESEYQGDIELLGL